MVRVLSLHLLRGCLLALAGALVIAAPPALAQGSYSVSGAVRRDADANGNPADPDLAISGIVVRLYSDPNGDGNPADGTLLSTTATDVNGSYQFTGLVNGTYVVQQVDVPGSISTYDVQGSLTDSRAALTLIGQDLVNIDFLDFGVSLYAISGHVYVDGPLNDALFGPDDLPVGAVQVHLFADLNANGLVDPTDTPINDSATGTSGRFGFGGLARGNYVVQQIDPQGATSVNDRQGSPTDNQVGVVLTATDVINTDFLDQGILLAALRGSVKNDQDGDGNPADNDPPLVGVSLLLFTDPNGDGNPFDGSAVTLSGTNLTGQYAFTNLPPGSYVVFQFDSQGANSTYDAVGLGGDNMVSGTLNGTDITGLDFLDTGALTGSGSGIVYQDAGSQSGTFTPDDLPVVGVVVRLHADLDGDGLISASDVLLGETVSSVGGSFAFPHTVYGNYLAEEIVPAGATAVNDMQGSLTDALIAFQQSGSTFQNLLFLNQGIPLSSVSGFVRNDLDADGDPADNDPALPNVRVRLFTDPNRDGDPADGALLGLSVTNAQGFYQLASLAPNDYVILADDVLGASSTYDPAGPPTDSRIPVTLSGTSLTNQTFLDTGAVLSAIAGTVFNEGPANDGAFSGDDIPLLGVFLRLYADVNENGQADIADILVSTTATSRQGTYQFTGLPAGPYLVVELDPPGTTSVRDSQGSLIDNTIAVQLSGANVTGRNFLDTGTTFSSIIGAVRDDADEDGNITDPDQPIPGVSVTLYIDLYSDGLLTAEDLELDTVTTNSSGQFTFTNLPGGSYLLRETDPRGSTSTGDSQGPNNNLVAVQLTNTNDTSAVFLDAYDPTGYIYDAVTGEIIPGGSVAVSGPGSVSLTLNGANGQYNFVTDGTPGTYSVTFIPPPGFLAAPLRAAQGAAFDPTGLPDPTAIGAGESTATPGRLDNASALANPFHLQFSLAPGDPLVINNNLPVVRIDAPTFAYWSAVKPGAGGTPQSNQDADLRSDLLEYAFHTDPLNGVSGPPRFGITYNAGTGKFEAFYTLREQGLEDLDFKLKLLASLAGSPAGWTDAVGSLSSTSNGDGTRTYRLADLAAEPPFTGSTSGFVRLEVALDADHNGAAEATALTGTEGWQRRTLPAAVVSASSPLLLPAVLEGPVTSASGSTLNLSAALQGTLIQSLFLASTHYYVEILAGPHAGHRLEILEASSSGSSLAVDLTSSRSTLTTLPGTLAGATFVIRPHRTLSSTFAPASFASGNNASSADRVMIYNTATQSFTTYWLFTGISQPYWVREGDATLANQNNLVIDSAQGTLVQRRNATLATALTGQVRASAFVFRLLPGQNLIGTPWPISQSPVSRAMTAANGFTGAAQAGAADLLSVWKADAIPGANGYDSYFLLKSGPIERWVRQGDATLQDRGTDVLFESSRAVFIKSVSGMPAFTLPAPWTP